MGEKKEIRVSDICQIGIMVAVIEVCKGALTMLPNIEMTTFLLIMFAIYFGKKVYFVVPVMILIEGAVYGIGLWWFMYIYTWPILVFLARRLTKNASCISLSVLAGIFGLTFGLLGSIPYFFIGAWSGGIMSGVSNAIAWWIAGIPWDLVHGVSNFIIMLVLYHPMKKCIATINNRTL